MNSILKTGDLAVWRPYGLLNPLERSGRVLRIDVDENGEEIFYASIAENRTCWGYTARVTFVNGERFDQTATTFNPLDALWLLQRAEAYLLNSIVSERSQLWAPILVLHNAQDEVRIQIAGIIGVGTEAMHLQEAPRV